MKKIKPKKRGSVERVYQNGKEAIVKDSRRKVAFKKPSARVIVSKDKPSFSMPGSVAREPSCAIQENKNISRPVTVDEYELPSYNATNRITLIVKDPFWIYAYWEMSDGSIEDVKRQLGGSLDGTRFILRMYDVTYKDFNGFNANNFFDTEIGRYSSNWYINLWNDNASYCAEIGIIHNSGRFFPMARSNFVHTPRSSSSNRFEEIWMDLSQEIGFENIVGEGLKPSPTSKKAEVAVQYDTAGRFSREQVCLFPTLFKRRKIYLSEADLRAYYSRFSPLLKDMMFSRISRKKLYRYLYSSMSPKEWQDMLYFRRLHGARFGRRILTGASESMFLGGSEKGASEFTQPDKKRKFFFEIGAELIVYGRTEPDAELILGDKKINLRPDGTFSMRFALPDGKVNLPFAATSSDKVETRKISTEVERKTQ